MGVLDSLAAGDSGGSESEKLILGLLGGVPSEEEIAAAQQRKQGALSGLKSAATTPMRGENYSPFQHMVASYLSSMKPGWNQYGLGPAIAAPYNLGLQDQEKMRESNLKVAQYELSDAEKEAQLIAARQRAGIVAGASLARGSLRGQTKDYKIIAGTDPVTGEPGTWFVNKRNPAEREFFNKDESKQLDEIFKVQFQAAKDPTRNIENPTEWAWENAKKIWDARRPRRSAASPGTPTEPPRGVLNPPPVAGAPVAAQPQPDVSAEDTQPGDADLLPPEAVPPSSGVGKFNIDPSLLPPNAQAELERVLARAEANPENRDLQINTLRLLDSFQKRFPQAIAPSVAAGPGEQIAAGEGFKPLPPRDFMGNAAKAEIGKEWPKQALKERTDLNTVANKGQRMNADLDLMAKLVMNPDVPEGEAGPIISRVRSTFNSIGIPIDKNVQSATDLLNSLATSYALHQRTANGENLLPGAMSEWEDQMLLRMAPGLMLTKEGSLALIEFTKAVNNANRRLAEEANKRADASPHKILPIEWQTHKLNIANREMLRLKFEAQKIVKKFNLSGVEP